MLHKAITNRVCRVTCSTDQFGTGCYSKSALSCRNATVLYREFARSEALRVAPFWDAPPIVLRYLSTGDNTIRVAAQRAIEATSGWGANAAAAAAWATTTRRTPDNAKDIARTASWSAAYAAADKHRSNATRAETATYNTAAWVAIRKQQNRRLAKLWETLQR